MWRNIAISYNLSETQFDLICEFFNEKSTNSDDDNNAVLSKSLLQKLMSECLQNRANVLAHDEDVDRSLSALNDASKVVSFEEFVRYLSLFFASKHNLAERIQSYLNVNHSANDTMLSGEAVAFANFLKTFFGVNPSDEEEEKNEIKVEDFISDILPQLEAKAFVKWETE
jgi:lipopolysaccharide biosynthesis protein